MGGFQAFLSCLLLALTVTAKKQDVNILNIPNMRTVGSSCSTFLSYGAEKNGYYRVVPTDTDTGFVVYCDFTSEPGAAWTLVLSYSMMFKDMEEFQMQPFQNDVPVNEQSPNWISYRMTKDQMEYMKSESTHWRITCDASGDNQQVLMNDYIRAKFNDIDIMTYNESGTCKNVEYINVRKQAAAHTSVALWQTTDPPAMFHMKPSSAGSGCNFNTKSRGKRNEEAFGVYKTISSGSCASRDWATHSVWFGSYSK